MNFNNKTNLKAELSNTSFEQLQKLKETIGTKAYNAALFTSHKNKSIKSTPKCSTKDAPIEMSAKKPVPRFRESVHVKKKIPRDPRFDSLCGSYNEDAFKNAYSFISDVQRRDIKLLKKELNKSEDPETINKIKFLIQRLENKLRADERKRIQKEKKEKEKKEIEEALKSGRKPNIIKKSDKKILDLVEQFEDLKKTGKLKKHINRIRKKHVHKDRKKLSETDV